VASAVEVANRLNEYFPFDTRTSQYFTLIYGVLDTESGLFRYISAGHPGPVLAPAAGRARVFEEGGPPLGLLPNPSYEEQTIQLGAGDRLYFLTDGLIEAESPAGEEFGMERLVRSLTATGRLPLEETVDALMTRVATWAGEGDLDDDATMLALEME
jgi:sigma-B regulation protein RsbU (phosphoserine phosphatase)